jgi:hypothetical protein
VTSEQEIMLKRFGREAAIDLCHLIINNIDELVELATIRASTEGVKEYGDTSYHKNALELKQETMEELADAIFYRHITILQTQKAATTDR